MTEFYLIRHGKTVFNQEGRFQGGKKDSALLKQSIEDAKKAGEYLKGTHFEAFFSSPMGRSKQTGKAVLEGMGLGDVSIGTIEGLREFDFGNWDGDLCLNMKKAANLKRSLKILKILCRLRCREKIITSLSAESNMLLKKSIWNTRTEKC